MRRLVFLLTLTFALIWGGAAAAADFVALTPDNLFLTPAHGGDGSAWGKAGCRGCHVLGVIHANAPRKTRDVVRAKGYDTCTGCHGSNGTRTPRRCAVCHNVRDLPLRPMLDGLHSHDFSVAKTKKLDDAKCLACHLKSDMDGRFEPEIDLTPIRDPQGETRAVTTVSAFCLGCHNRDHQPRGVKIQPRAAYGLNDPLTAIEDDYTLIDRHGAAFGLVGPYAGLREAGYVYGQEVECVDCHAMHGTRNGKLILDDSRKGVFQLSPVLRFKPHAVEVVDGNYAPLCVLCHNMDDPDVEEGHLDAGNGLSGVHDASSDCTECHVHGEPVRGGL